MNSSSWCCCFPVEKGIPIFQLSITCHISSFHSLRSSSITATHEGDRRAMHQTKTGLTPGFFMHPSLREQRLTNTSEMSSWRCTEGTFAVKTSCHSQISRQLVWFFLPTLSMFSFALLPPAGLVSWSFITLTHSVTLTEINPTVTTMVFVVFKLNFDKLPSEKGWKHPAN